MNEQVINISYNRLLLVIVSLSIMTLSFYLILNHGISTIYGISPSFVRQEVDDNTGVDDLFFWDDSINKSKLIQCNDTTAPTIDMKAISYESDINMLNSTMWFTKPITYLSTPNTAINTNNYPSQEYSTLHYNFGIINSSNSISELVEKIILDMESLPGMDIVELTSDNSSKYKKYKFIYKFDDSEDINIAYITEYNNTKSLQSFYFDNSLYGYKNSIPIIEQMINSTEFIEYNNTSYATYENPLYGLKFKYPTALISKNYTIFPNYDYDEFGSKEVTDIIFYLSQKEKINNSNQILLKIVTKPKHSDFTLEEMKREIYKLYDKRFIISNIHILETNPKKIRISYSIFDEKNDEEIYKGMSTFLVNTEIHSFHYRAEPLSFFNYLPIIEQMINSTEFIEYNNTSYATYENPLYGLKFKYPTALFKGLSEISSKIEKEKEPFNANSTALKNVDYFPINDLESYIYNIPSSYEKDANNKIVSIYYYMLIDVDSIYDKGIDYILVIQRNTTSLNWDRKFFEQSSIGEKLLDVDYNISDFTGFKVKDEGLYRYITLSLNLSKLHSPDKYSIILGTHATYNAKNNNCDIYDMSQILPVPPPNYNIKPINNNPLILYPSDEENVNLQINSNSPTNSIIYLKSSQNDTIDVSFSPNILSLNSGENGNSKIKIKTNGTDYGTHTLLLSANATFPKNVEVSLIGTKKNFSNPVSSTIPLTSSLTITVEKPPEWHEPYLNLLNNLGGPLTPIATAVTIVSSILGLNIWKRKKRIRKRRTNKINNKQHTREEPK